MVCPYRFCVKLGGRDLVLVNVPVRGPAQSLWANPQKKKKKKVFAWKILGRNLNSETLLMYLWLNFDERRTPSPFSSGLTVVSDSWGLLWSMDC